MKSLEGRPLIEAGDSPRLVDDALHSSIAYWQAHKPPEEARQWQKTAADAWGAMRDGFGIVGDQMFRPDGEALLYMNPDDLKLALIAYGCQRLDEQAPRANTEVVAINGLLKSLDHLQHPPH